MTVLNDITAKASNSKRPSTSASSVGYKGISSPGEQENKLGMSRSPHFMTPTFASKQSITPTTVTQERPSTPASIPTKQSTGSSFLKRVGLRRMKEAPRSQESVRKNRDFFFPDKLANSSYTKVPASPPTLQQAKISPRDKPLPSAPDQYINTSPIKAKITLIDATEKPLRRSPTGMRDEDEDWPALQPKRIVSTTSVQDILRESGIELKRQVSMAEEERYPKLGDTSQNPFNNGQLPVSAYSPLNKMLRQDGVSPEVVERESNATMKENSETDSNFNEIHEVEHVILPQTSHSSASAAALEKSVPQDLSEVRQTRTSSLRARLSAGEVTKDRNGRVVGFTECTTESSGSFPSRQNFRERKEAHTRLLSSPSRLNSKASRESIGNRAPAKVIAGSRRSGHPRRPASRGSLHDDMRAIAPSSVMPSSAIPRPASRNEESRRSSIPASRAVAVESDQAKSLQTRGSSKSATRFPVKPAEKPSNTTSDVVSESTDTSNETLTASNSKALAMAAAKDDTQGLPPIDESPRNTYKVKRLSTKSPEHGPMLTISPSADRYIMGYGSDSDKENLPLIKERVMEPKTSNGPTQITKRISSATKKRLERPSSSNGHPSPRASMIDPKEREKKVQSVELGTVTKTSDIVPAKTLSKNPSVITNASSVTGPFFDASEEPSGGSDVAPKASMSVPQDEWISPLAKINAIGKPNGEDAPGPSKSSIYVPQKDRKSSESYDPFKYDSAKPAEKPAIIRVVKPIASNDNLTTPKHSSSRAISPDNHPPRSTSRMEKPNITVKTISASATTQETGPPTPPKDISARQNNLGSSRGLRTSQIDLLRSASKNRTSMTSKDRASMASRNRDSIARESLKSHASSTLPHSVSKSRFNLKGLFHKRSSESRPITPVLRSKRSKVSITATGSPVVPQSDIHPLHRRTPTQSPSPRKKLSPLTKTTTANTPAAGATLAHPTHLTIALLEAARIEQSSPKKERLLELGKVMVDVITRARDAEKAVEEAKLAAKRAEKAREGCERAVVEVGRLVEGIKGL